MKVRIVSDGTPAGTKILTEDGRDLELPIAAVGWKICVDDVSRAVVELPFVELELSAGAVFVNSAGLEATRIEWADGTSTIFPDAIARSHEPKRNSRDDASED